MRIAVKGWTMISLGNQLEREGETITDDRPDLILSDELIESNGVPVIGGDYQYPIEVVDAFGYDTIKDTTPNGVVFRWFDRSFRSQILMGTPFTHLMNEDLGAKCEMGMAARFVSGDNVERLFNNDLLVKSLQERNYIGFVSFLLYTSFSLDELYKVVAIRTGVPYYGMFNVLEGVSGRLVEYLTGDTETLQESWSCSQLLSRYPFPHKTTADRIYIDGINPGVEKHFYWGDVQRHKRTLFTDSTRVGVSASWATNLPEACRRVLRTLRNLRVPLGQYRIDLTHQAIQTWRMWEDRGVVNAGYYSH